MKAIVKIDIERTIDAVRIFGMGSQKKPADANPPQKRGPGYRLDVFQPYAEQLAARRGWDVTQVVRDALRKELEQEGLWPPPDDSACGRK